MLEDKKKQKNTLFGPPNASVSFEMSINPVCTNPLEH